MLRVATKNYVGAGVAYGSGPTGPVTMSATADAAYPAANLYDEQTAPLTKWSSLEQAYQIGIGLNYVPDGDAEQATIPSAWVPVTGVSSFARSASPGAYKGSFQFALAPSSIARAAERVDVVVPAGAYLQFRAATQSGDGARFARVQVIDMEQGGARWLAADGTWAATEQWLCESNHVGWTTVSINFQVPTYRDWGRRSGVLRVVLDSPAHASSTGNAHFDEVLLIPAGINVVAFVGHNFPRGTELRVYTYADYWHGGAATAVWNATNRLFQPVGWLVDVPISAPYIVVEVRFPNSGTAYRAGQIGELFVGRLLDLPRSVRRGLATEWREEQTRIETRGGVWTSRDRGYPSLKVPIDIDLASASNDLWPTVRDEIAAASGFGVTPMLLIPSSAVESEWALFGHLRESFALTTDPWMRQLAWEFQTLPVPFVG